MVSLGSRHQNDLIAQMGSLGTLGGMLLLKGHITDEKKLGLNPAMSLELGSLLHPFCSRIEVLSMKKANSLQRRRQHGPLGNYFWVFIMPAFAVYFIFSILPFVYTIFYSFTDYTDLNPTNLSFVGFKNYLKVFNTPVMKTAIKNSVLYAILLTGFQIIFQKIADGLGHPTAQTHGSRRTNI